MKRAFSIYLIIVSLILPACATFSTQSLPLPASTTFTPSPALSESTAVMDTAQPVLIQTSAVEVSTAVPAASDFTSMTPTPTDSTNALPASYTVTMDDNGKTLNLRVGDSFLLNLGADMYDWNVNVDNQSVISLHMGMMVIKGAQGIFDAHIPGAAILTAAGDPRCRASTPPCMMPSILFKITVVVQ